MQSFYNASQKLKLSRAGKGDNMKKSIFLNMILAVVLLSLLVAFGCVDKKSTDPDEILDYDGVDVTLIDNWDLWEYEQAAPENKMPGKVKQENSLYRDGFGFPALVEELYANIQKHAISINAFLIESANEDIESVHMMDCQIWSEDTDEIPTYYYDYYYDEDSGALWLRSETTADTVWVIDPLSVDSLGIALYDTNDFTLLYRHNAGPMLNLLQPPNNSVIPDPDNDDLDDLTPLFKWNEYNGATEYTLQVRLDTLFSQSTGFVINELLNDNEYETPTDLENFSFFYWRVKADNSNWSNIWNFAAHQVVILSNPVNRNHEGMKPRFVWDDLQGATEYTIQVSDVVDFANLAINDATTDTEYNPTTNLQPETKYYWKVKGNNSGENWSDIWSLTTDKRIALDPNATPFDDTTEIPVPVEFDWPNISNATEYQIQVAMDSLFANVVLDDNSATSDYIDTGILQTNNEFFWRINSDVAYDWSDTLSFNTNDIVLLNSPENTATSAGVITEFIWEKFNDNETVYVVQVAEENTFANPIVDSYIYYDGDDLMCETSSRLEFNEDDDELIEFVPALVEDFEAMTTHYWRVQRDTLGWSETWSFTTLGLTGAGTVLTEPLDVAEDVEPIPQFKWTAIPGADFYRLEVTLDPTWADTLWVNKVVTDPNYTLDRDEDNNEMLLVGETYYWRVHSDRTDWSDVWSLGVRTGIPYDLEAESMEDTPNKVDLSWECMSGEYTDFWIERSDDNGTTWTEIGSAEDTANDFADFNLDQNTTYYYRARTEYPLGYSEYSEEVSVTTAVFVFDNRPTLNSVAGGTFSMGSLVGDDDETPVRSITLTHDYEIGEAEVTNTEYCEVLNWALGKAKVKDAYTVQGYVYADDAFSINNLIQEENCQISFSNIAKMFKIEPGMEDYPVSGLTWYGAIAYSNWMSMIDGYTTLYTGTSSITSDVYGAEGYRLPTEAEWEFAAIGGNTGNDYLYSGSDDIEAVAWYILNANDELHAIKGKADNDLNLFDMSGNAWEWCNDKYDDYDPAVTIDPIGPTGNIGSSTAVCVRGGSWEFEAYNLRNANRSSSKANLDYKVNTSIGFRIVKINP
jgi:formylglycine-generating enzyme required for sulfatase activity